MQKLTMEINQISMGFLIKLEKMLVFNSDGLT